jgi:hypothetical protein
MADVGRRGSALHVILTLAINMKNTMYVREVVLVLALSKVKNNNIARAKTKDRFGPIRKRAGKITISFRNPTTSLRSVCLDP